MRSLAILLAGTLVACAVATAQESGPPEVERQITHRVAPVYPDLARRVGITGMVRMVATITPAGAVKSVSVVGGNPVLIDAAIAALKAWKFAPAPNETRQLVELRFSAH